MSLLTFFFLSDAGVKHGRPRDPHHLILQPVGISNGSTMGKLGPYTLPTSSHHGFHSRVCKGVFFARKLC